MIHELPKHSLHTPARQVTLQSPLILKSQKSYMPLRDWANFTNGKLKYSRRDDIYTLTTYHPHKTVITLHANSPEITINGKTKTLAAPTIFYKRRLYVPIHSFFTLQRYAVIADQNRVILTASGKALPTLTIPSKPAAIAKTRPSTTQKKKPAQAKSAKKPSLQSSKKVAKKHTPTPRKRVIPTKKPSSKAPFTSLTHALPKSSKINLNTLPKLKTSKASFMAFGLKQYPIKDHFLYQQKRLYIDVSDIVKKEGFTVAQTGDSLTLSKAKTKAVFTTSKPQITVLSASGTKIYRVKNNLIFQNKKAYIPIRDFAKAFGYKLYWDEHSDTLRCLTTISHVVLDKKAAGYTFSIYASQALMASEPITSSLRKGFYIDIPYATIGKPDSIFLPGNTPFLSANLQKKDDTTVRLTLLFREPIGYFPLQSKSFGGDISFFTSLTKLSERKSGSSVTVTLKSNGPITYKTWGDKTNRKFVLDIPNTVSKLPQIIRSKTGPFRKIRSSQLNNQPPKTRIVFDLVQYQTPKIKTISDEQLTLTFTVPKTAPKKTASSPAIRQGGGSLKGKVIVIDAGHGGGDPGAVIHRRVFEKKYTLDIATRLATLLKKEGAYVILTRNRDRSVSLRSRAYIANKNKADALISIHINSFKKSSARGTETYYFKYSDKRLAASLQREMSRSLKLRNNGIKRSRMFVLRYSKMPAALVEPLFITNPNEYKLLKQPEFRQKIANSLFRGTKKYFLSRR